MACLIMLQSQKHAHHLSSLAHVEVAFLQDGIVMVTMTVVTTLMNGVAYVSCLAIESPALDQFFNTQQ